MYQRMLVPLDGSELAEVVFAYAKELAGRLGVNLIFLHVCSPEESEQHPMHRAYIEHAAEVVRGQSQAIQEKLGIQPGGKPIEAQGEVVIGYPAEEILRYVEENNIDLILMATHGRSGIRRWRMGSVADKVLRVSEIPVWLVRPGIPEEVVYDLWPRRTALVPLDGSELAESVLPHVEMLARQHTDEREGGVVLLRVCEPPTIPSYSTPEFPDVPLSWAKYEQEEIARGKQAAKEYLAGVEKRLKDSNINVVRSEVLAGRAADEIVDYTKKNPFNLIIMATHGRSGLGRWVYGSVAEHLLQEVSCPILLIKPH